MSSPSSGRFAYFRSRGGAALVIILAFVVLLTGLIVAFFSRAMSERQVSNSSANQAKVELFSQGAIDTIVGDLKQEIAAGSIATTGTDGITIFSPVTCADAVPFLSGTTGVTSFAPNLLKRSAYNQALYSGSNYNVANNTITITASGTTVSTGTYSAPSRAANVSTGGTSQNGRFFSNARWNKALLLPKLNPSSSTDLTPVTTGSNAFLPPDWILVARSGTNPTTWNSNLVTSATNPTTVVGRYAYAIYDEGGLLDVNVAGYPSVSGSAQYSGKGSLAYADLTVVGLTPAQSDAIVGWRNYASGQPSGSFPSYTFSSGTNYYNFVLGNTNGFLATGNSALVSGQSDRMFSSRQQLINFLTQGVATGSASAAALQNALQYLSTFSRDLEQPSFVPDPNRPKNADHGIVSPNTSTVGYGGNDAWDPTTGGRQDLINPSLLTVRSNGNPVMRRRFPLSRLALIGQADQTLRGGGTLSSTMQSQIYQYFGLAWDTANARWVYYHQDAAASNSSLVISGSILKLSEIAALSGTTREPDFFETLKAVIDCDTLGKQNGGNGGQNSSSSGSVYSPHLYTSNSTGSISAAGYDGKVNYQLIQIGANLIDQYGADSYPTRIAFDSANHLYNFCGVKNLPYLTGAIASWYRMRQLGSADIFPTKQPPATPSGSMAYPYETWTMCQPILWNPHAPMTSGGSGQIPTSFQVAASGPTGVAITICPEVRPSWWAAAGPQFTYPAAAGMTLASWAQSTLSATTSTIAFTAAPNTTGSVPASFQEPYRLLYHYPPGTGADAGEAQGKFMLNNYGPTVENSKIVAADAPVDGNTVIGFFTGKAWTGNYQCIVSGTNFNAGETANCLAHGYFTDNLLLQLQYRNPYSTGPVWLTYDVMYQVHLSTIAGDSVVDDSDVYPDVRNFETVFRVDPRTDRWGEYQMNTSPMAINPTGVNSGTAVTVGSNNQFNVAYNVPQGTTMSPYSGFNTGIVYRLTTSNGPLTGWPNSSVAGVVSDFSVNTNVGTSSGASAYIPGNKAYYNDPDHVLRRASGGYMNSTNASNSNDGLPFYTGNYTSRPVVLNRPFQSVAEMGYAFSDTPWKELDFFMPESGDSALLDAFCMNELDNAPVDVSVAGRVDLNTKQPKVLQSLIQGVSKAEGGIITNAEAANAAQALVTWTSNITTTGTAGILTKGPLRNRAELVGKFISTGTYNGLSSSNVPSFSISGTASYSGYSSMLTSGSTGVFSSAASQPDGRDAAAIKRRRECVMRALADSGNTRTWNLLIDVVAQTGRYPANASNLNNFVVEGETRYWVHLAVDRYTGNIVAKLVEPVSE